MRVLLINPSSWVADTSWVFKTLLSPLPPQGIAYIAAVLEKDGVGVSLIDQYAVGLSNERLVSIIDRGAYDLVGFSCLTPTMGNVTAISGGIRKLKKEVKVVLGNIHATVFAEELLEEGIADIVVRGEGEYTMRQLTSVLKNHRDLSTVEGISFRQNGKVIRNTDREPIRNLDELPYPAWHLLDLRYYKEVALASLYETAFPMQASRGCPYRCIFCAQEKIHSLPRYRKIETVVDELEHMHKRFRVRTFGFNDAYFPFSFEHGMGFCEEVIARGLHKVIKWGTELRVDQANRALLKKMKEAGVHIIMYGFESGNQDVLNRAKKKARIEQAYEAMRLTKEAGILSLGFFILGLPGETKKTCQETIAFAKKLDCDFVKFNIAIPYPGSEFYEMHKDKLKEKLKEPEKFTSWYDWSTYKPDLVYIPEGMTAQELIRMQRKAMFEFYVRPRIIIRHIIRRSISLRNFILGAYILVTRFLRNYLSPDKE